VYGRPPLRCAGAFEKSCVRRLYRCFDAAGSCTRDIRQFFTDGVVTDCWQNGARITLSGFHGTGTAGRIENYSPDDVTAAGCGPIADCQFGACP